MKISVLILIVAVSLPGVLIASSAAVRDRLQFEFEHLTVEDGLAQSTAMSIFQDSKGFMWFGTINGLNKYDGKTFTLYQNDARDPNSISHDVITGLCETPDGMIWIGTYGGGLNRFDPRTETFTRFQRGESPYTDSHTISHNLVWNFNVDQDGILWIGTLGGGLNKYDAKTGKFTHYWQRSKDPKIWKGNITTSIYRDRSGILWLGSQGGGLLRFDPKTEIVSRYHHDPANPNSLCHNTIWTLAGDRRGFIWIGTYNGLCRFNPADESFVTYRHDPADPYSLSHNEVTRLYLDKTGMLWVSTLEGALNLLDLQENRFYHIRHRPDDPNSISMNAIGSFYESRDGILWLGTNGGGINKLIRDRKKMTLYRSNSGPIKGLSGNNISTVYEDTSGILWIGMARGGLNRVDRKTGKVTVYKHDPKDPGSLASNLVSALTVDPSGRLWVATHEAVHRFKPGDGTFTRYRHVSGDPTSLSVHPFSSLAADRNGKIWVGTLYAGLSCLDPQTGIATRYHHHRKKPDSLSSNEVNTIYIDRGNTVWIGTMLGGLERLDRDKGTFVHYRASLKNPNSLSDNDIYTIFEDRSGVMWIGTGGGGLNKFDRKKGTFIHYTTKDGLPNNVIYAILEDRQNRLWISTNRGISRFDPAAGVFLNYGHHVGIQGYEFNLHAAFKNRKGEMFFGGPNGLNSFFPSEMKTNPHVPMLAITGFKLFNQTAPIGGESPLKQHIGFTDSITLSYRQNTFSLEFAALDYANPAKNQYKYKLEGLHGNWIQLGHKNDISFTGLEPGHYSLKVKGSNNDGIWNEQEVSLGITITPPFWATWWFRGIFLLLAAVLVALWHRTRMNQATLSLQTETRMNRLFAKYAISEREQEIVRLVMKGKSNNDIEEELYISLPTVKKHIYNIYKKLGVKNRLELINFIQKSVPKGSFPALKLAKVQKVAKAS